MLLGYFGQAPTKHCEAHCDICETQPTIRQLDVTSLALEIGKCIQKFKNDFNGKKLTVKQLSHIITGKKMAKIVNKKYNELPGYGCFFGNVRTRRTFTVQSCH